MTYFHLSYRNNYFFKVFLIGKEMVDVMLNNLFGGSKNHLLKITRKKLLGLFACCDEGKIWKF